MKIGEYARLVFDEVNSLPDVDIFKYNFSADGEGIIGYSKLPKDAVNLNLQYTMEGFPYWEGNTWFPKYTFTFSLILNEEVTRLLIQYQNRQRKRLQEYRTHSLLGIPAEELNSKGVIFLIDGRLPEYNLEIPRTSVSAFIEEVPTIDSNGVITYNSSHPAWQDANDSDQFIWAVYAIYIENLSYEWFFKIKDINYYEVSLTASETFYTNPEQITVTYNPYFPLLETGLEL